ncbi:iron complex outermembrane recepter protein [Pseudomonas cuatrocienegasensis]|uniref:Iron complex outermembrane recepter protein n=1 Tax=Pseudomonas cuatrocienegasensis TaxID=543360 RepID=A0ABY1BE60_9PSED|nr:TonB-dependent receptor [Pseudomonas sp. 21C1]SEQ64156.1 iron complex outermembrane recepter protein [Pseudomonas cuatrocienegasensis]
MKLPRIALAVALLPSVSSATSDTSSYELPPLVVTRATALQKPAPASVKVIDRKEIEASASTSLVDVLRGQAGVQVRDTIGDGSRANISLRGFGENSVNNTLVLVDGRRLNQPAQSGPDFNSVPLANIERIEIIRGAGTVLYGDQAVGGVINIITRTPSSNEAYIESSIGSHDLEAYRGHISQQLGAGFAVYASGETRNTDNYRDRNNANYSNTFARLRYDYESGHTLYEYQTVDDELLYPGSLSLAEQRADRKASFDANGNGFNNSKTQVHRFALEQQLNNIWSTNFDYSYSDQDGIGAFNFGSFVSPFTQGTRIETFSPRITARFDNSLGHVEWLFGHDHISSDYEYQSSALNNLATQTQRDWYTQLSQNLGQDLTLTAGYRNSEAQDTIKSKNLEQRARESSSSLGLSWQANQKTRLFIKREDVLRWANVDENVFANPNITFLKPQTGESWEGGVEWDDAIQRYQASIYRLQLKDELLYDPTAEGLNSVFGFDGANINLDKTLRKGVLLEAERQLTQRLSLGGQYTYTDSEYLEGSFKGNEVSGVARHSASIQLGYQLLPGLNTQLEAVYTGSQYLSGDDAHTQNRVDGYTLLNAAITYDYEQLTSKLRINNLTGTHYDAYANLFNRSSAPEEQVQLSVGYRF